MVKEPTEKVPGPLEKIQRRLVFISHAHADRDLVRGLQELVTSAFSGVVDTWASSDPSAGGGLPLGTEWYEQINIRLSQAEAVWVVATPISVKRPWIYWEAGIGRALAPGGVVVLRVGLGVSELPSPLDAFPSFDGLVAGEEGIDTMLRKVADQVGMAPPDELIQMLTEQWLAAAPTYEPKPEADERGPALVLSEEQVTRIEAAVSRLESVSTPAVGPLAGFAGLAATTFVADPPSRITGRQKRQKILSSRVSVDAEREQADLTRLEVAGSKSILIRNEESLRKAERQAPPESVFTPTNVDLDGDLRIAVTNGDRHTAIYLRGDWLDDLVLPPGDGSRIENLLSEVVGVLDEEQAV